MLWACLQTELVFFAFSPFVFVFASFSLFAFRFSLVARSLFAASLSFLFYCLAIIATSVGVSAFPFPYFILFCLIFVLLLGWRK